VVGNVTKEFSMSHKNMVLLLGFAGFISAADNWIVAPILPAIAAGFDVSIARVAVILTAYMIPYGVMQPVYGFLSDRWGKARVLQRIVAGLALGTLGCATASSLMTLCLWRIITGFFAAGIIAVSLALIGDAVPVADRQKHVGKFMGIVFLGQGLSVGIGGIFARFMSWRVIFVLFGVLAFGAMVSLRTLPKENSTKPSGGHFFTELKRVLLTPRGRVIFPLAFATGFLLLGSYSYLGAFLHEVDGLDYVQVGMVVMFFGFACLIAGSKVGAISGRLGWRKTIVLGGLIALFALIILALFPYWQMGLASAITLGIGYIFTQSTLATLAFDVACENKGLPSALIGLGLFGGGGLGSSFGGVTLSMGGYNMVWWSFAFGVAFFTIIVAKVKME
jgi:predicted MFS family arabinose efflux permease